MRAVFVCEDDRLVGVVTRKTLVREVVASGRDPATTTARRDRGGAALDDRAGPPIEEAFRFLEDKDAERVPVVDERPPRRRALAQLLQRRLAEDKDEPPPPLEAA